MGTLPLVRNYGANTAFAYCNGHPVSVDEFLRDAADLAALLPDRRHVLNVCADRYRFTVGFAAALLRRQISLLPPSQAPHLIEQLARDYQDLYCVTDAGAGHPVLETVFYPSTSAAAAVPREIPEVPASQTAAILFTSGSTGEPLPYPKTWRALVNSALAEADCLGLGTRCGMAVLGTVPPQHMYGLESTVLMPMQNGHVIHSGRPFFPADVYTELEGSPRPRGLVTTPVHLRALLTGADQLPRADLLLCATAPLSPQLAIAAETRFAAPLFEIYGCTEAGQVATRRTVETDEWRVLSGLALRQDANGTWVSGGHVESEVLLNDVIELRGTDTFLLHGRTTDLVNIAGKRTSLATLNYHLNSIDGILDGVFFMPEDESETVTRLIAFVVAPALTDEAVMKALRQRIDAAFLPRPLYFVESLPRSATGKLPREALRQLATRLSTTVE
jgi:acyl-coenzyme A synthetase/AMP-(fatty) acid ligase